MKKSIQMASDLWESYKTVDATSADGKHPFLLVCEHASNHIPAEFDRLGLSPEQGELHIAWDPGALQVSQHICTHLGAPLVASRYSRLLYDCNRPPEADDAMPEISEIHSIPGNLSLDTKARKDRVERFYLPFKQAVSDMIVRTCPAALVTIHSFTPMYHGQLRDVEIGILHGQDARLAHAMIAIASAHCENVVRINEPYGPRDGVVHTLDLHGTSNGILNVMVEIRSDLIDSAERQARMAEGLAGWLTAALETQRQASCG